tara:strand:- start:894 stop:1370 length:477 start_codon:yes stop_codon:yes gene_type:complete
MSQNSIRRYFCCAVRQKQITTETPTWNNTKPFVPPLTGGNVIKVYDGDTITIASKLPFKESPMYRWSVRLNRIDTPEMKSKDPELKKKAQEAQKVLSDLILGKDIQLENVGTEKFGRVLADIIFEGKNLNDWMLEQKLAYEYKGNTKLTEAQQLEILS